MKRFLKVMSAALTIIMIMVMFTSCGEIKKAEESVNTALTSLKALDFETASGYMDVDGLLEDDSENEEGTKIAVEDNVIMVNIFDKLEYKIISSEKIDKNTVVVKTEITAVKMEPVLKEFLGKMMQYAFANAFANPQPTEEEQNKKFEEMFVECVSKEDLEMLTTVVDIKVVRVDKQWQLEKSDKLVSALLGGMYEAIDTIDKDMESMFD